MSNNTKIIWLNRNGVLMEHTLGFRSTLPYARNWFRRSITECQGILSEEERMESQLRLIEVINYEGE